MDASLGATSVFNLLFKEKNYDKTFSELGLHYTNLLMQANDQYRVAANAGWMQR